MAHSHTQARPSAQEHSPIRDILAAETRAQELIARAKAEAEQIVTDERRSTITLLSDAENAARKEREMKLGALKRELEAARGVRLEQQRKHSLALAQKAQQNTDAAIDVILARIRGA